MSLRPEPTSIPVDIKYYLGSSSELSWTENPNDKYLYRKEGGDPAAPIGILTRFNIKYFSFLNEIIETPGIDSLRNIALVEVTMEVQSPYASYIDEKGNMRFASALWRQTRLASQNLRR
jgi:hypothetical protein